MAFLARTWNVDSLVGRVVADYNPGQDVLAEWRVPHPRVYSRVASAP